MVATGQLPIPQITRADSARDIFLRLPTMPLVRAHRRARRVHRTRGRGEREARIPRSTWVITWATAPASVERNRALVLEALDAADVPLVVPARCTGKSWWSSTTRVAREALGDAAREALVAGADALVATVPGSRRCCASPTASPGDRRVADGRFAVAHAGWRGVENGVAAKAVHRAHARRCRRAGEDAASGYNARRGAASTRPASRRRPTCAKALRRPLRFLLHSRRTPCRPAGGVDGRARRGRHRSRAWLMRAYTVCSCDEFFDCAAGGICGPWRGWRSKGWGAAWIQRALRRAHGRRGGRLLRGVRARSEEWS